MDQRIQLPETRPQPNNLVAERGLLGCILNRNDCLFEVLGVVSKDMFYEPAHGELFTLLRDIIESGRLANPITVLNDTGQDADIGGVTASVFLRDISEDAPESIFARQLASQVRDLAMKRKIIDASMEMAEAAASAPASVGFAELAARYDAVTGSLFASVTDLGIRHVAEIGDAVLQRVAAAMKDDTTVGLDVGLKGLQDLIGSLMPGRLYVLGGAPGSGKSALAQQIAKHCAHTVPVLFEQIEMEDEEMVERDFAAETGITADRIERAALALNEYEPLAQANAANRTLKLYIDRAPKPTVSAIRGKAMRMQKIHGLGLLVVDHLLYVERPSQRMDPWDAIRENLQGLKRLAKDLHIPVLVLAQLKAEYAKEARSPNVGDLFGGSAIEQEADVIWFVHRMETVLRKRLPPEGDPKRAEAEAAIERWIGIAEFILAKRRGGKGYGTAKVGFDDRRVRFTENPATGHRDALNAHLLREADPAWTPSQGLAF